MSAPSNSTRPVLGVVNPAMIVNSVVLPAPLGPISPVMLPAGTPIDASATASNPPNRLLTLSTVKSVMRGPVGLPSRRA